MKAVLLGVSLLTTVLAGAGTAESQSAGVITLDSIPEAPARPVVVELFTSQNCVMCPPANRNVALMAKRKDVVVLTFPVGYWDYLGETNELARPEFAERQKRYNKALGHRGPYTPQIVFGGLLHSSGGDISKIAQKFAARDTSPYPVSVTFDGGDAVVSGAPSGDARVVMVRFRPGVFSDIPSEGANRGKDLGYFNLATHFDILGLWTGGVARYKAGCVRSCVVLVHDVRTEGPVIGVGYRP
jgi:hypothetical protein